MNTQSSRRQFLKTTGAAAAAVPFILPSRVWAEAPSNRFNLGFIGVGTMGRGHLGTFLSYDDVQIVAVAEVSKIRRDSAIDTVNKTYAVRAGTANYKGCGSFVDYRELLARKDVDAVVIATPDHWHTIPCIQAAAAKKDIYCEKPLTVTVAEALAVVAAARKHDIVFQTGSQQRTEFGGKFRKAVEIVRSGRLGKIKTVRVGVGGPAKPCDLPAQDTPAGTDWDRWLGPAPERAYNEVLCPRDVHKHFPAWRNFREYAGGGMSDMGAHHFDIAQWALGMDENGPVEIIPPADAAASSGLVYKYANGIEMIHGGPNGCTFEGTEGTLYVDRGKIESNPATILTESPGAKAFKLPDIGTSHRRNWLDCIRSRKRPVADVAIGASTSIVCALGNLGYQLRRNLKWDPKKHQFVDDGEANGFLSRKSRGQWAAA
ncbi:MAG: twin-arginine translocation signal domain-containing protein [Pedosphaera sp.]|nr:twin-arginine translocation signal domain-containing protein [Pedosphaera sp.]